MRFYKPFRILLVPISQSFFGERGIEVKKNYCYVMAFSKTFLLVGSIAKMSSLLLLQRAKK